MVTSDSKKIMMAADVEASKYGQVILPWPSFIYSLWKAFASEKNYNCIIKKKKLPCEFY